MVCKLDSLPATARFANNKLFAGIPPEVLTEIGADLDLIQLESGDVVFREGERGSSMFLVGDGKVKISKAGRGGLQETLGFIEPGSFFGEMALLDGEPRSAQATAVEPTLLGSVNEAGFNAILELAPSDLHLNFLRCVVSRLRGVNNHFITEMMRSERLNMVGTMANSIIHDLKSPITVIQCCTEMLARKTNDSSALEFTDIINKSLQGMMDMTQELLDYARGNTSVAFSEIPFCRVLEDLDTQMLRIVPAHVHYVKEIRCNPTVKMNPGRFVRVLLNLVKNGIEAMHGCGVLRLSVSLDGEKLCIAVSDTGCGIPEELQAHIFEPFVTMGKANGTGLGMAIAKSAVEMHGGTISLKSKVGEGTRIEIRLPIIAA